MLWAFFFCAKKWRLLAEVSRTSCHDMAARSAAQTASPPKTSRANVDVVFSGLPYKLHRTVESVFFVQNFVWKNYRLLLVESTSNFAWALFWRKFTFRVIYFCQIFSASKIFVKLLFIWAGLDVFPFKMLKKEACHRVQHVKISRNWSSSYVGRLCACLKNQTFERQWKMCSTGLNACNLGYGVSVHESAVVVMANMANTGKTVQVVRWSRRKRPSRASPGWTRDRRNDFSRTPVSSKIPPKWGKGNFFLHCHKKCQFCFTQEIKGNLNFAPKVFQTTKTNWYKQKSCSKKVTFLPDSTIRRSYSYKNKYNLYVLSRNFDPAAMRALQSSRTTEYHVLLRNGKTGFE